MKKLIAIAALAAMPAMSATITYDDGTQVEVPDDWAWSVKIQVKAPPKQCPPQTPWEPPSCPPPPVCPSLCDLDPGNDKCRRQVPPFDD